MRIRRMRSCGSAPRLRRVLCDRALTCRTWYWPRGRRLIGSGSRSARPWLLALTDRWPTFWMRWPARYTTADISPAMPSSFCRIRPPVFCLCSARSWPSISAMRVTWWCWRRRTWSCVKIRRLGSMVERRGKRHTSGRWPATAVWPLYCRSWKPVGSDRAVMRTGPVGSAEPALGWGRTPVLPEHGEALTQAVRAAPTAGSRRRRASARVAP